MLQNAYKVEPSGNSFIDENHDDLLGHLSALQNNIRNNSADWDKDRFRHDVDVFIQNMENHFSHEEIILKGAGYSNLNQHKEKHRSLMVYLHKGNLEYYTETSALEFLNNICNHVTSHELVQDQDFWHIFDDPLVRQDAGLLFWSEDLMTGNEEIDKHHLGLLNHINRFCLGVRQGCDNSSAAKDLELLAIFARYHFNEEEKFFSEDLKAEHIINHRKLINDLEILTAEVKAGDYDLSNLLDYFSYWLLAHIRKFDIPMAQSCQGRDDE